MSDKTINIHQEKALIAALRELPKEAEPGRDLWPEIASELAPREIKSYTPRWIPWSIAATLMVSLASFFVSWNNLQSAQQLMAINTVQATRGEISDINLQIKVMEQEYGLAKSALLAQIGSHADEIDNNLLRDVKSNLLIIERATDELKSAINKQPENPSFPKLLKATYQQELVVLSQLAKLNQDI